MKIKAVFMLLCIIFNLLFPCVNMSYAPLISHAAGENFIDFNGGEGTEQKPYKVSTPFHLEPVDISDKIS